MDNRLKIAFDVGGVLSKYPQIFTKLIHSLDLTKVELYVISDVHNKDDILDMLNRNGLGIAGILPQNVYSADYNTYGEECKRILCDKLHIDILIDDFIGYVANGDFVRLLVMPNSTRPYYHNSWKTNGNEGDFGRHKFCPKNIYPYRTNIDKREDNE